VRDLRSPNLIVLKGLLLLVLAVLAGVTLIARHPDLVDTMLLVITVWAACRFYFCTFYVIGGWVDPVYRFDGLLSFAIWCGRRYLRRAAGSSPAPTFNTKDPKE
jgi:hypothetical protein